MSKHERNKLLSQTRITLEGQQMEQKKKRCPRHDRKFTATLRTCQKRDTMYLEKQTVYLKFYCHI